MSAPAAMELPFAGGCACGACRYTCDAPPFVAYTCHCRACQKLSSSAFATCLQVPAEALALVRGTPRTRVRTADSGSRLETSFCGDCGSALFVANERRPRTRTLLAGSLDHPERIAVTAHIWTSRRLPWVVLPPGHRVFEGAGDWRADYASDPGRLAGPE